MKQKQTSIEIYKNEEKQVEAVRCSKEEEY